MGEHNLPDHIDHPVHYTQGIECIDYILSHNMDYLEGNIVKYVTRYKFKHGVDDLRKAEWYLKRLLKREALGPAVELPKNPGSDYWPPVDICAKPIYIQTTEGAEILETPEDHALYHGFMEDMAKEKHDEIVRETGEAMCEEFFRNYCDNYIKPHFPRTKHEPWPTGTGQLS